MANLLSNCGFLDGATGWTKSAQLGLSVDETVRGSSGRAVLIGSGATTAASQTQFIGSAASGRGAVVAGQAYEVAASLLAVAAGALTAPTATVVWYNASGAALTPTSLTVRAAQSTIHGEGLRGVRNTFRSVRQKVTAPAGAVAAELRLAVTPSASGSSVVLGLLKPQIAPVVAARTEPLAWDPGRHSNPDLMLATWPTELRGFDLGPDGEPVASASEFQGSTPGRPSRRRTGRSPARQFKGVVRCLPYERALLDDFWSATEGDFWMVEPGSDRLCVASFAADGQPRMTDDRGEVWSIELGLWLETA